MAKQKLHIVKIGGNIINTPEVLRFFLKDFASLSESKILVHGGGRKASELSEALGQEPKMIAGRRVTDAATLEIVTMVYGGLLNKNIVAELQQLQCNAVGLTGADANCIEAHKRVVVDIDYGFAGDIDSVNNEIIDRFLQMELTPVFCALTHDKKGQLLNTNADTIAAEIAVAMSRNYEVTINYIFEHKGVLESVVDPESVIDTLDSEKYEQLVQNGVISAGMLPKLHNCFTALEQGVSEVRIGNGTLLQNKEKGTTLRL